MLPTIFLFVMLSLSFKLYYIPLYFEEMYHVTKYRKHLNYKREVTVTGKKVFRYVVHFECHRKRISTTWANLQLHSPAVMAPLGHKLVKSNLP